MTTSSALEIAPSQAVPTVEHLQEVVKSQALELRQVVEGMADLQLAIEDRGWSRGGNQYEANGLDLASLRIISQDLRSWIVAGGIVKKIIEARGNTIYGDGVGFRNYAKAKTAFESAVNITKLFSASALQEINRAHGSDGTVVFLVNKTTKEILRYSIIEMGQPFLDSDDRERVWFVRRKFTRITPDNPAGLPVDEYYATDLCPPSEAKATHVRVTDGIDVKINHKYTAVVWDVNRQIGWPLGIPDLLPVLQWAEKYTDFLKDQSRFAKALAQIAWQYRAQTTEQAIRMAASIVPDNIADTIIQTPGMDLKPLPGNSAVSFDNGRAMAAQAAAAGEITVETLLADGQYNSGAGLDPDVRKMAIARRNSATEFFKRIGKLLGAPNLVVIWPNLDNEDPFRDAQMVIAGWGLGLFKPEEIRGPLARLVGIDLAESSTAPSDVLIPGTKSALQAAQDVLPAPVAPVAADGKPGTSAGDQNGQGVNALGVGKLSNGDNTARDNGETGKK